MEPLEESADVFGEISDALSDEVLREALSIRERFVGKYRPLLGRAEKESSLIRQLLSLREDRLDPERSALAPTIALASAGSSPYPSRHPVVDNVAMILEEEGHPLHISEIMRFLQDRQIELPGRGEQANVIAHIRRDPRFVRPSRGVYGLAAWGLRGDGARRRTKKKVRQV